MIYEATSAPRGEGRLWAIALGLSVLVNVLVLAVLAMASLRAEVLRRVEEAKRPAPTAETVVTIFPEVAAAASQSTGVAVQPEPAVEEAARKPQFARTSEDQASETPKGPAFIGERNTTATSDRAPDAAAPELPSQKGRQPLHEDDLETTESRYQDGQLAGNPAPASPPSALAGAASPPSPETTEQAKKEMTEPTQPVEPGRAGEVPPRPEPVEPTEMKPAAASTPPPAREELLAGPNPVDVQVPKPDDEKAAEMKPTPYERAVPIEGGTDNKPAELPKPKQEEKQAAAPAKANSPPPRDPAFAGNQRKAAIVGSISRTGRSALNVVDTPLGRYQAAISKAVEREWQLNCTRYRDFIVPGYLTVRFFVEPSGKVKTLTFVGSAGQQETGGEVQKGFTLNAIRDAEIPPMPAALKKDYEDGPLELIFNFYF